MDVWTKVRIKPTKTHKKHVKAATTAVFTCTLPEFGVGTRKWSKTTNPGAVACIGSDTCSDGSRAFSEYEGYIEFQSTVGYCRCARADLNS